MTFDYSNKNPWKMTFRECQAEIDYLIRQKRGRRMAWYVSDGSSQRYWKLQNRIDGEKEPKKWWEFWK